MKLGIVGLPNVGKSTLFNSLTQAGAEAANYPFCTINPNVGVVPVPDERLKRLDGIYHAEKVTPAVIEFVDIAGLVKGASRGEGLGNQFLSHIREVDAVVHVVRCFEDENVIHVDQTVDPLRDIETIDLELIYADLDVLDRRLGKASKAQKVDRAEVEALSLLKTQLDKGICARSVPLDGLDDAQRALLAELNLLTAKPVLYAANVGEDDLASGNSSVDAVKKHAAAEGAEVFVVCAKIEDEIAALPEEDKQLFLQEMGVEGSGLDRLIAASYRALGLISFLTAGPKEVRAWTITKGTKAPQAAGKIHSDFERGFIRAEVVPYDGLIRLGSLGAAKEHGLVRSEGKDYVFQDGDVVLFRFNV